MLQNQNDNIIKILRRKRYKATPQRIAICNFVLQSQDHPSAQVIYKAVKKEHPTVSLATVYKTLQVLKELNLVQELTLPDASIKFDTNLKPHINLICLRCGEIRDIHNPTVHQFVRRIAEEASFKLKGRNIDLYGICQKCLTS